MRNAPLWLHLAGDMTDDHANRQGAFAMTLGAPQVLVVDADPALLGLLEEWLDGYGCSVVEEQRGAAPHNNHFDIILVDVPFPRHGGLDVLRRVKTEHPGAPVVALSANFFASIESTGAVARALGVASVLPKPVTREALITAVRGVLRPMR